MWRYCWHFQLHSNLDCSIKQKTVSFIYILGITRIYHFKLHNWLWGTKILTCQSEYSLLHVKWSCMLFQVCWLVNNSYLLCSFFAKGLIVGNTLGNNCELIVGTSNSTTDSAVGLNLELPHLVTIMNHENYHFKFHNQVWDAKIITYQNEDSLFLFKWSNTRPFQECRLVNNVYVLYTYSIVTIERIFLVLVRGVQWKRVTT